MQRAEKHLISSFKTIVVSTAANQCLPSSLLPKLPKPAAYTPQDVALCLQAPSEVLFVKSIEEDDTDGIGKRGTPVPDMLQVLSKARFIPCPSSALPSNTDRLTEMNE